MYEFAWLTGGLLAGVIGTSGWLNAKFAKTLHLLNTDKQAILVSQAEDKRDLQNLSQQLLELKTREQTLLQESAQVRETVRQEMELALTQKAALASELDTLKQQHHEWKETVTQQWEQQFKAFLLQTLDTTKINFEEKATKEYQEQQTDFQKKMQEMVKPLSEMVEAYKKQITELGTQTLVETGTLKEQIQQLVTAKTQLVLALSHNKGRGDWGELELLRLLEDSGLMEGIHFTKQQALEIDHSRPDIRIHLPGERYIFVDAKALQVDLEELNSQSPDEDAEATRQKKYARSLREAIKNLNSKEYQRKLDGAADFVVLYVPREIMLNAALLADPTIFEEAFQKNIVLSGPLNLIGLLKIVRLGWYQSEFSQNAQEILELGKELYRRAALFTDKFEKVGKGIETASKAYNDAMITFSGGQGFLKQVQRLERYGCNKSGRSLPKEVKLVETQHEAVISTIEIASEEVATEGECSLV